MSAGEKKERRIIEVRALEVLQDMRLRQLRSFARLLREEDPVQFWALLGYMQAEQDVSELAHELEEVVHPEKPPDYRGVHPAQLGIPPALLNKSVPVTATEIDIAQHALVACHGCRRKYKCCGAEIQPIHPRLHGHCATCEHLAVCHGQ